MTKSGNPKSVSNPNRRHFVKILGGATAASFGSNRTYSATPAGYPEIGGVDFVTSEMEQASVLSKSVNQYFQTTPAVRAICHTQGSVAETVNWAREKNKSFAVRSSGHCFAGFSQHAELVIDTRNLNYVRLDMANEQVRVGAGTWFGDVYRQLGDAGLVLPGGTVMSVGAAGLTLGGGLGYYSRQHGLLCDQLKSISVVDATGRAVSASMDENPDLFWACRGGGGGSLGIATELTFNLVPMGEQNYIQVSVSLPMKSAARIIHEWQHWTRDIGRETTTHLQFSRYTKDNHFLLNLTGISGLPRSRIFSHLQALLGSENPLYESNVVSGPYAQLLDKMYNWFPYIVPVSFHSKSHLVETLITRQGISEILDAMARQPVNAVKTVFEALGGAVSDTGPNETAYPHRNAAYGIFHLAQVWEHTEPGEIKDALDKIVEAYRPHVSNGVYVNYPDRELPNWADAYWGNNLPRLIGIKNKWDPENLFNHPHSIPAS